MKGNSPNEAEQSLRRFSTQCNENRLARSPATRLALPPSSVCLTAFRAASHTNNAARSGVPCIAAALQKPQRSCISGASYRSGGNNQRVGRLTVGPQRRTHLHDSAPKPLSFCSPHFAPALTACHRRQTPGHGARHNTPAGVAEGNSSTTVCDA